EWDEQLAWDVLLDLAFETAALKQGFRVEPADRVAVLGDDRYPPGSEFEYGSNVSEPDSERPFRCVAQVGDPFAGGDDGRPPRKVAETATTPAITASVQRRRVAGRVAVEPCRGRFACRGEEERSRPDLPHGLR